MTRRHVAVTLGVHVGGLTTPTLAPVGGADGHETSARLTDREYIGSAPGAARHKACVGRRKISPRFGQRGYGYICLA